MTTTSGKDTTKEEEEEQEEEVDPLLSSTSKAATTATTTTSGNDTADIPDLERRVADLYGKRTGQDVDLEQKLHLSIQPETFRFYAYVSFWGMALLAIALTEFVTAGYLAEGIQPGEPECPPFERFGGKGFDIHTESHLIEAFGFNNICSNWDYSPSREITALVYPIFEYTLILYIVADFINVALANRKGWVSQRYWMTTKVLFPVMLVFCSWFRMIFVMLAYKDVRAHTAGFLGLQLVLMMVACLNVWYLTETKMEYSLLGGRRGTQICAIVYLVVDLTVSALKFGSDAKVVLGYGYPSWGLATVSVPGHIVVGQVIDMVWMLTNAILPLVISYVRSKSEQPLQVTIDVDPPKFLLDRLRKADKEAARVKRRKSS